MRTPGSAWPRSPAVLHASGRAVAPAAVAPPAPSPSALPRHDPLDRPRRPAHRRRGRRRPRVRPGLRPGPGPPVRAGRRFVRVRGERARYLGRGPDDAHLKSDLVHRHLGYLARATAALPTASAETRAMVAGFAAGYSYALAGCRSPRSPRVPWRRVARADHRRRRRRLRPVDAGLASSRFLAEAIADARPEPAAGPARPPRPPRPPPPAGVERLGDRRRSHRQRRRRPVGNPHFPWQGDLLFHEAHLTIPGDLDVYGVALLGTPGDPDRHHAAPRVDPHLLGVDPPGRLPPRARSDRPLRYRHGDETRRSSPSRYAIAVRGDDGAVHDESYTRTERGRPDDRGRGRALGRPAATRSPCATSPAACWRSISTWRWRGRRRARSSRPRWRCTARRSSTPSTSTATGDALYVDGSRVPDLVRRGPRHLEAGAQADPRGRGRVAPAAAGDPRRQRSGQRPGSPTILTRPARSRSRARRGSCAATTS
jgi:hypothetical protein